MDDRPPPTRLFEGCSVLVTGASSGIGRAVALAFAGHGAAVGLLARRADSLDLVANEIASAGGLALALPGDVTDRARVGAAVRQVVDEFGGVDILVNSAGLAIPASVDELSLDDLHRMMNVNYFGMVHTIEAVLPLMRHAGAGNIVNLGSTAGRKGFRTLAGYCASKFAIAGFTEALRNELTETRITASLVIPAAVDTPMLQNPQWKSRSPVLGAFMVPADWIASAVMAAVLYRLAEVDVPVGSDTILRMTTILPNLSEPWFGFGARMVELFSDWIRPGMR